MIFQVVARRVGVGRGVWHDRPFGPTTEVQQAREQHQNLWGRYPRPVAVVILAGEDEADLSAQFDAYVNDKTARLIEPSEDGVREAIEFAPVREHFLNPLYLRRFADYAWGTETFRKLVRLMTRVHAGELGGPDDGA